MTDDGAVIDWLLDPNHSDPWIRWQVMRDLVDAPESMWAGKRTKVETEGWGARLLSHQDEDGQWAGGAFIPIDFEAREGKEIGQPWTATTFSLSQLREFGLEPSSDRAQQTVESIGPNSRWDHDGRRTGKEKSRSASTAGPSPTGPTSGCTSHPSSTGWWASVSTTADGTVRGPMAPLVPHSRAPSTFWKGCWSSRKRPEERPGQRRRA